MKRILSTTFMIVISLLLFENVYAQSDNPDKINIPQEGDHFTMTNVNQQILGDLKYQNKTSTLDIILEKLEGKTPWIGYGWQVTSQSSGAMLSKWIEYPTYKEYNLSKWASERYIPAKPGKYIWAYINPVSEKREYFGEVNINYKSDPIITSSAYKGFLSNLSPAKKGIIESDKDVQIQISEWFTAGIQKGKNNIYKDDVILDKNKATYTLKTGKYKLEVFDGLLGGTPQIITFEIKTGPEITQQPLTQTLIEGESVNLLVEASGGDLTYQWVKNGSPISGATNAKYSIVKTTIDDTGKYKCVVTNSRGNVSSEEVAVTVGYKKPTITTQPTAKTLNETENLTLTIAAEGNGLTYQWQKNAKNIDGATETTYYKANVTVADAGEYQCIVTNTGGSVKSNLVKVAINYNKPTIITQPKSVEIVEGNDLNLKVEASGSNLSYVWKKNNVAISGVTSPTYTKVKATKEDAGIYTCTVSNQAGSVTSTDATVTIKGGAPVINTQPQSQDLTVGSALNLSVNAVGDDLSYQWKKDGSPISGATTSSFTIKNISSSDSGSYLCVVTNPQGIATSDIAVIKIVINANIPVFDGLKSEYSVGSDPVTIKVIGTDSDKFKTFKVNGITAIQFNPSSAGTYEIEAITEDGKASISTYVIVK